MSEASNDLARKALSGLVKFLIFLGLLLFLSAWSLKFWQGWLFLFVFSVSVLAITFYFLKHDPALIARRLEVGPVSEQERSQKIIQTITSILTAAMYLTAGFDYHFRWCEVPATLVVIGDGMVAVSFFLIFLVFKENSFASATIELNDAQTVISTGPYRIVRHPMYAGALLLYLFTPIALGSYCALVMFPPILVAIALRLVDEERFLSQHLPGYDEYRRKVRYRLFPRIW